MTLRRLSPAAIFRLPDFQFLSFTLIFSIGFFPQMSRYHQIADIFGLLTLIIFRLIYIILRHIYYLPLYLMSLRFIDALVSAEFSFTLLFSRHMILRYLFIYAYCIFISHFL